MCVFCSINDGSIPSTKLYESEHCIVIFDINPVSDGHVLVVTKKHYSELSQLPDDVMLDMMQVVKRMYPIIHQSYSADGVTTFENYGLLQEIDHVHFHIVPIFKDNISIDFKKCGSLEASLNKLDKIKTLLGDESE